jgi:predicted dehydrogenase
MNRLEFLRLMGLTAVGAAIAPSALAKGLTAEEEYIKPTIRDLKANVDHPISVVILGAGSRGNTYASYARRYPDCMKVVGVADINAYRKQKMAKEHNIEPSHQFNDWSEAFLVAKFADAVVISLPDDLHYAPCIKALQMGYHVLLEKPIAPTEKECTTIRDLALKKNAIVGVCHVLRYAPYFIALKEVIDSGVIGKLVSIQHMEPIQYAHMAHSYVRGNWHNSKQTTPIILAKSCHDLDILRWMVGSPCRSISAYGNLMYFTAENKPQGAPARCTDGCPHEGDCPYSAIDIYVRKHAHLYVFDDLPKGQPDRDIEIRHRLETTDYGRCVFQMDNDQCDHYVANMEFENGVTAAFSMEAFMVKGGRRTQIMGTRGEIVGDMSRFVISDFRSRKVTIWDPKKIEEVGAYVGHGHGGGDLALVRDFVTAVANNDSSYLSSPIDVSVESHIMGFRAEQSRKSNRKVSIK